jgi:CheY-like chemotaxis protein
VRVLGSGHASRGLLALVKELGSQSASDPARKPILLDADLCPRPIKGRWLLEQLYGVTEPAPLVPAAAASLRHFGGMRVLLVEDNLINQRVASRLLEKLGCRVDLAANGVEALELAAELPYRAILLDCQMPVMDGFTAARLLRELPNANSRVPILALTAGATPQDRERCFAAGMNGFMTKPVTLGALAEVLNDHCAVPSGEGANAPVRFPIESAKLG